MDFFESTWYIVLIVILTSTLLMAWGVFRAYRRRKYLLPTVTVTNRGSVQPVSVQAIPVPQYASPQYNQNGPDLVYSPEGYAQQNYPTPSAPAVDPIIRR